MAKADTPTLQFLGAAGEGGHHVRARFRRGALLRHYFAARPETSINLTHCPANARKQHLYNLALRVALLIRHSLNVSVHGDFRRGV